MDSSTIKKISPLYEYWNSDQDDDQEAKRLLMANNESPAVSLFSNEPYKWEILYQSIVREIVKGDQSSISGLKLLISTIKLEHSNKMLVEFSKQRVFDESIIEQLSEPIEFQTSKKRNLLRFLRILLSIFFNPYGIIIRRNKNHIYEKTGSWMNYIIRKR